MTECVEYRILGPLEVDVGGRRVPTGGPKQRTLLAVLLVHANQVVPVTRLVDAVWGEAPPTTAVAQVQGYVSVLRRLLPGSAEKGPILTRAPGYLLQVEPGQLDVDVFERLAAEARSALAGGRVGEAAEGFRAALALWRGPVLGGVAGDLVEAEAARLEERRLSLLVDRIEADLALGRHTALVAELTALVATYPFQEGLRSELMLALYRAGRQAEALEVYRETRQTLVDELGVEPGPELRSLQEKILRADRSLELAAPAAPPAAAGASVLPARPAQLPPGVADFTGRAAQVAKLCDLLARGPVDRELPAAVVTAAIAGSAGVGKTALALHVAHRLGDSYPDGQLYANLRGAERQGAAPGDVLAGFLRALGVDAAAIPRDTEERAVLYRSLLAGRRLLVVLDNAAREPQVRPLLPGSPGCAVVITSRARLVGLEGAHLLDLGVLEPEQAVELLSRVAGAERVAAEPEAAWELARRCGYLPLAVRISGAKLKARPHRRLAWLSARLGDAARRLDELTAGDLEVRASLALSYEELDEPERQAFRRLGLLEAQDFSSWVVAALLDAAPEQTEELVDALLDAQLLEVAGRDATGQLRYRFHDLLRCYARERAAAEETDADRAAALERAVGAWLGLAEEADSRLGCAFFTVPHGTAPRWHLDAGARGQLLADPLGWFESERAALLSAVRQSAASGMPEATWDLALSCAGFFEVRGYFDDWRATFDLALTATRRTAHRSGEAAVLRGLGELHTFQDRYDTALACFTRAGELFAELGDRHGQAVTASGCGLVCRVRGRHRDALAWFGHALATSRRAGLARSEAYALLGMGTVRLQQGDHEEAAACFSQALGICREAGYRDGEAQNLWRLGMLAIRQADLDRARTYLAAAQEVWLSLGTRLGQAHVLQSLGELHLQEARTHEAAAVLTRCLEVYRELGDRYGEALTLDCFGRAHFAESRLDPAAACFEQALCIWRDLRVPIGLARTLVSLGDLHWTRGNRDGARAAWDEALSLFRKLDVPEGRALAVLRPRESVVPAGA